MVGPKVQLGTVDFWWDNVMVRMCTVVGVCWVMGKVKFGERDSARDGSHQRSDNFGIWHWLEYPSMSIC